MRITPVFDFLAKTQKIYLFVPEDVTLNFENDMHKTFGFLERRYKGLKKQPNGKRVVFKSEGTLKNYLNEINTFYVYSDIVEYQVVGDVNAPLLRLVASNQTNGLNFMSKVFDSPHYLPVSRNNINTIEIDIRSSLGDPIYFTSGEVVVKLHFRRKNYF